MAGELIEASGPLVRPGFEKDALALPAVR